MVVIGAKGLAKEVLEIYWEKGQTDNIFFYDDVNKGLPEKLFNRFPIIKNLKEAQEVISVNSEFTLGLGVPTLRHKLYLKFTGIGGCLKSSISLNARIGHYDTIIEDGCTILMGTVITNGVYIGMGTLVNPNCTISHDVTIGKFSEISPGVQITGNVSLGSFTKIGSNATILPKLKIGSNSVIGAGAVITKDVPDNCLVVGVPGRIVRILDSSTK